MNERFRYLGEMLLSYDAERCTTADIYAFYNEIYLNGDRDREKLESLELLKQLVIEEVVIYTGCECEYMEMTEEYGLEYTFEHAMCCLGYTQHWKDS